MLAFPAPDSKRSHFLSLVFSALPLRPSDWNKICVTAICFRSSLTSVGKWSIRLQLRVLTVLESTMRAQALLLLLLTPRTET
jgi:hypothetical protein